LGDDTKSFELALLHTLRQEPGVIYIGEMRTLATMSIALTVSETKHMLSGTLHPTSAAQTIERIIDIFRQSTGTGQSTTSPGFRSSLDAVSTAPVSRGKKNNCIRNYDCPIQCKKSDPSGKKSLNTECHPAPRTRRDASAGPSIS